MLQKSSYRTDIKVFTDEVIPNLGFALKFKKNGCA